MHLGLLTVTANEDDDVSTGTAVQYEYCSTVLRDIDRVVTE